VNFSRMPVARNDSVCGGGAPEAVRSSARPPIGGALMPVRLWPITCSRECVASMCLSLLGSHPSPAPAGCFRVPLCGLMRNAVDQLGSGSPDVVFRNHAAERSTPVEMVTVCGGSRTVVELPARPYPMAFGGVVHFPVQHLADEFAVARVVIMSGSSSGSTSAGSHPSRC